MDIERLDYMPNTNPNIPLKVTTMGNVIELQYMSRCNHIQTIQMLEGGEQYVICATGEVKDVQHYDTRRDNKKGLYKTFAKMRGLINANVTDVDKVRWCTLTYADNMTDVKQLYKDFECFNKRFNWYCKQKGYTKPEYIVIMEPQGRGAWHAHLLYIWQDMIAPYIANDDLNRIWGHGFVKVKKLDNVDNVGAYLTAYVGDMDISDMEDILKANGKQCKIIEMEEDGKKVKKAIVKGGRLDMYPANFNMFRYSRGCKKPTIEMLLQNDANKKVLGATKTFESAVKLTDSDNDFDCIIVKQQYNMIRNQNQYDKNNLNLTLS